MNILKEKNLITYIKHIFNIFMRNTYIIRPYVVTYPLSFGAMTIHDESYSCFACCKYHAFLQFIEDTVDEDHYSASSIRTPLGYLRWTDDIKRVRYI